MSETVEPLQPKPHKPLGHRAYGSIPHLPGSRRGPADWGLSEQQADLLIKQTRDKHDVVVVQEKLDGSCVSVAKLDGQLVPLIRAGYAAITSNYEQHRHFHNWVLANYDKFDGLLQEGERVCGEWLMEAHGTRYDLPHDPFVAFDLMQGIVRLPVLTVEERCQKYGIVVPRRLHIGGAISIEAVLEMLEPSGHGALDGVEGAVWRMERKGSVDFLGKYVRHEKEDGKYFTQKTGQPTIYNWKPQ